MNALHTPGPWKACRSHEEYVGPYFDIDPDEKVGYDARPFTHIESADGTTVSAAHDLFEFKTPNALLMAASPELLAALRICVDYIDCIPESAAGGDDEAVKIARTCRAVIAKATEVA